MKIGLLPLDERPVNTRYPKKIGQIAGCEVVLPPESLLSTFRNPAMCQEMITWLEKESPNLDALIISIEMLGYGGLIASRTTHESTDSILARLGRLQSIKRTNPSLHIDAFNLIMRVSNANSAIEEPPYWAEYGQRLYRYSQLIDEYEQGQAAAEALENMQKELPHDARIDFIRRRLRNHAANLAVLGMLANDDIDRLILSSDDTSLYGLPSSEKRSLANWAERLGLGSKLLMYPGADEVASALVARAINRQAQTTPTFEVHYAVPGGESTTAPYEDGPVSVTVERQVQAVGGAIAAPGEPAEFYLAVNPPVPRRSEWNVAHAELERQERLPHLKNLAEQVNQRLAEGQPVIIADVAYPNGADPVLIDVLFDQVDLNGLAAYGAWNTAGNTIGVALAQGCAAIQAKSPAQLEAQQRFLRHRFLEDWGYQHIVRRETRDWLAKTYNTHEVQPETQKETVDFISKRLAECLSRIPGGVNFQIAPGSVKLPWDRLFEVDFEIEN